MAGLFRVLLIVAFGAGLAGCSYCDFPLYWPQSCKSGPGPTKDAPPPGR